jgi:hypothetical protein
MIIFLTIYIFKYFLLLVSFSLKKYNNVLILILIIFKILEPEFKSRWNLFCSPFPLSSLFVLDFGPFPTSQEYTNKKRCFQCASIACLFDQIAVIRNTVFLPRNVVLREMIDNVFPYT